MSNFKWDIAKIESVENFVSQEEADLIINYCEDVVSRSDKKEEFKLNNKLAFPFAGIRSPEMQNKLVELEKRAYSHIIGTYLPSCNIRFESLTWRRDLEFCRWTMGGLQGHRDGHEGVPPYLMGLDQGGMPLSSLIYLTDNFDGGDLYFADLDYRIKPKALSMVTFPSFYLHEVTEITKNESDTNRYTIPFFYGYTGSEFSRESNLKKNSKDYEYKSHSLKEAYNENIYDLLEEQSWQQ